LHRPQAAAGRHRQPEEPGWHAVVGCGTLKADRSGANAATAAQAASTKADAAQATANQAMAAAQAAQTGVSDLNAKIDRMFERSVSK
jgi:hypothetical protein